MKKVFLVLIGVMLFGIFFNALWDKAPIVKTIVHGALDPTLGALLNLNIAIGYVVIIAVLQFLLTLIQKYTTDQEALKKIRDDQKAMQIELKKYAPNDPKAIEMHKQQLADIPKNFELALKPIIYTALPIILLFRWFADTFKALNDPKFFGLMGWFGTYFVLSIIFSIIFRKKTRRKKRNHL